jgi:hypothetical protein
MKQTNVAPTPNACSIRIIADMVDGGLIAGSCGNRDPKGRDSTQRRTKNSRHRQKHQ